MPKTESLQEKEFKAAFGKVVAFLIYWLLIVSVIQALWIWLKPPPYIVSLILGAVLAIPIARKLLK